MTSHTNKTTKTSPFRWLYFLPLSILACLAYDLSQGYGIFRPEKTHTKQSSSQKSIIRKIVVVKKEKKKMKKRKTQHTVRKLSALQEAALAEKQHYWSIAQKLYKDYFRKNPTKLSFSFRSKLMDLEFSISEELNMQAAHVLYKENDYYGSRECLLTVGSNPKKMSCEKVSMTISNYKTVRKLLSKKILKPQKNYSALSPPMRRQSYLIPSIK